ncbi:RDD family protein [Bacillus massilinigeriensis]|uniref:RDD family protein n=1 Tax=Bacillus mediterraneensis TaxID=1805474 RepID=UPI0008F8C5AB|nr:RDD family protein [Bacillus mediterraneensis]
MEMKIDENFVMKEEKDYGGFWIRFAANLIDGIILGIPLSIIGFFLLFVVAGDPAILDKEFVSEEMVIQYVMSILLSVLLFYVIAVIVSVGYYAGMHSSKIQGTVGKMLLGLKVTDINGKRISFWRGLGRYFAMFLSSFMMIGYLMAAFTEKKQSLHDMIAGTVVIKSK